MYFCSSRHSFQTRRADTCCVISAALWLSTGTDTVARKGFRWRHVSGKLVLWDSQQPRAGNEEWQKWVLQ